jgi:hypothetical protein
MLSDYNSKNIESDSLLPSIHKHTSSNIQFDSESYSKGSMQYKSHDHSGHSNSQCKGRTPRRMSGKLPLEARQTRESRERDSLKEERDRERKRESLLANSMEIHSRPGSDSSFSSPEIEINIANKTNLKMYSIFNVFQLSNITYPFKI